MGYSTTFDISALTKENYLSTTGGLHPIYGMDRWPNGYKRIEDVRKKKKLGCYPIFIIAIY